MPVNHMISRPFSNPKELCADQFREDLGKLINLIKIKL